ncbi:hypothetical protein CF319_g5644 [Tilletia indica]|uniref:Small ribosomal subunit protein mS33 n=1 Tax=Tilletia indica TaxID=43049 RepID=A0A8T8T458_9BASI|nr:hypothetical protein CF319_g5644 [Tilletia indica]KAE8230899.1 hypothetical protein CF326_g4096 [Tilletia indica]KAE8254011.1 hypothetical protein A4X13_0g3575 [Tilletia indica]
MLPRTALSRPLAGTSASRSMLIRAASTSASTSASSSAPAPAPAPTHAESSPPASSSQSTSASPYTPQFLTAVQSASARPPKSTLQSLAALRASLFGTTYNPHNVRTGAKYLRKPLVGPGMLSYYPPTLKLSEVRKFLLDGRRLAGLPDDTDRSAAEVVAARMVYTPYELQRLEDVKRRKALGKGPPKKGEGRRAAMKNKTGKK